MIFGAVVIAFGFFIANLLARLIGGESGEGTAALIVKWATIVLFVFMGLQFTGIGGMIPGTALTILVAGVSVAFALAFGLGGRQWAARKLEELDESIASASTSDTSGTRKGSTPAARSTNSRRAPDRPLTRTLSCDVQQLATGAPIRSEKDFISTAL